MLRAAALGLCVVLGAAGEVAAQEEDARVAVGESRRWVPPADAEGPMCWRLEGRPGDRVRITVRGEGFKTNVGLHRDACTGSDARMVAASLDAGPLEATLGEGPLFLYVENRDYTRPPGAMTVSVERIARGPALQTAAIAPGVRVEGRLGPEDALDDAPEPRVYDCWSFTGRAGERVSARLADPAGADLWARLSLHPGGACENGADLPNDEGYKGRIVPTVLPFDGPYTVKVSAEPALAYGLTLTVAPPPSSRAAVPVRVSGVGPDGVRRAHLVKGALGEGDGIDARGAYYDCYAFEGKAEDGAAVMADTFFGDPQVSLRLEIYAGGACSGRPMAFDAGAYKEEPQAARFLQILPADGTYSVRIATAGAGRTSDYSFSFDLYPRLGE